MHPGFLLVLAAKKVVGYAGYRMLQQYGVAKAYRKVLRGVQALPMPAAAQASVQAWTRLAFRAPDAAIKALEDQRVYQVLSWAFRAAQDPTHPASSAVQSISHHASPEGAKALLQGLQSQALKAATSVRHPGPAVAQAQKSAEQALHATLKKLGKSATSLPPNDRS